jgi:hypothetical protein
VVNEESISSIDSLEESDSAPSKIKKITTHHPVNGHTKKSAIPVLASFPGEEEKGDDNGATTTEHQDPPAVVQKEETPPAPKHKVTKDKDDDPPPVVKHHVVKDNSDDQSSPPEEPRTHVRHIRVVEPPHLVIVKRGHVEYVHHVHHKVLVRVKPLVVVP